MPTTYSTAEVARKLGIHKRTLLGWVYDGNVAEPKHTRAGGQDVRVWSVADLRKAQQFKNATYRKGRGRKKKSATS